MSDQNLLTAEEVAQRLSIGRTKVYELMDRGELPSIAGVQGVTSIGNYAGTRLFMGDSPAFFEVQADGAG